MNDYERKAKRLEEAKKLWQESEARLDLLRVETGKPLPEFNDEEILEWHKQTPAAL